jgi:hypothetical protein
MATISIYIPDSGADRVFDAIAANYRYQPTVSNPVAGQNIITWASDTGVLLSLASRVGYVGDLPGTKAPDYTIYPDSGNLLGVGQSAGYAGSGLPDPIELPFVYNSETSITGVVIPGPITPVVNPFTLQYGPSGQVVGTGVITGQHPQMISNPETKAMFANGIVRGFLAEHTKVYELDLARKAAEAVANGSTSVSVDDGATATVYDYLMVCLQPAKAQYDGLASIISPGNSFSIPLSAIGSSPATHYGLAAGITETARQQLLVLELAGGTTTGGVQTMFYVRCHPQTHVAQATNISGFDIVGKNCTFFGLLAHLGLKEISE